MPKDGTSVKTNGEPLLTTLEQGYRTVATIAPLSPEIVEPAERRSAPPVRNRRFTKTELIVWTIFALLGVGCVAFLTILVEHPDAADWRWLTGWTIPAGEAVPGILAVCWGITRRRVSWMSRASAACLGAGILCWAAGDLALTIESLHNAPPPTPSIADAFYICFYPLTYAGIGLRLRGQVSNLSGSNWMDGLIACLGAAALCSAFAFSSLVKLTGGSTAATAINLAYPVGDVILLALIAGALALVSGRRPGAWILLGLGMLLNVAGDTANLLNQSSLGAGHWGTALTTIDAIAWPTSVVLIAMSVWVRIRPSSLASEPATTNSLLPTAAAVAALGTLTAGSYFNLSHVTVVLSTLTMLAVATRLSFSVRAMQRVSLERHRQSLTDELTGVYNRRFLFQVLDTYYAERDGPLAKERSLALLFIDLNGFKEINDSFGHPAGDELLRQLAKRMADAVREDDILVRIGGDEFAVVLVGGQPEHAQAVARRMTECLSEPFTFDAVSANVSASIGIAFAPADARTRAGLLWCADIAMYRAKLARMSVACYDPEIDIERDPMRLLEDLKHAIKHGELVLHYQPQLNLRSGEILAVEALVRWNHPRLGLLPPAKFLPLAEEAGLMPVVTKVVLESAARQCAEWRSNGGPVSVSVNVSPQTLRVRGFVKLVRDVLASFDLSPSAIVIEITETNLISESDGARKVIEELRAMGMTVSIDDFGAGVTSLAYLSSLAVGELKLDRTFISRLSADPDSRDLDIIKSTIDLAHAIGLRIVAEGIEDADTLSLLRNMGCDLAQGYCIGRPKPADELAFRSEVVSVDGLKDLGQAA
jgi:diguanylate cyclase (GGDEF)-like protein